MPNQFVFASIKLGNSYNQFVFAKIELGRNRNKFRSLQYNLVIIVTNILVD